MLAALLLASCAAPQRGADPQGVRGFDSLDTAGLLRLAGNFERAGDLDAAIGFYIRAMRSAPENPSIPTALGGLFQTRGDLAQAEPLYLRARALDPDHDPATAGLARLYVGTDRPGAALALLAPLHAAGRGTAGSFNSEAVAHDLLGAHDAARRAYTRALLEAPDDSDILTNLALSMAVAGEYAAAHDLLDGLAGQPGMAETSMENRALVLALEGRAGEAEELAGRVQPEATVRLNRLFYRELARLGTGPERARAVFLGRLPTLAPDPVASEAVPQIPVEEPSPDPVEAAAPVVSPEPEPAQASEPEPAVESPPESAPEAVAVEDAATRIPAYHLQLGSFSSEQRARDGWELYARQADAFAGLGAAIEPVTGDGERTLHRLLAGPVQGYSAGQAICNALAEAEIPCLVIPLRPDTVAIAPTER